jgi:hypothetical protein
MTMNQPIEMPVNDWNAQRTVTLIVEALADLKVELGFCSSFTLKSFTSTSTLELTISDLDWNCVVQCFCAFSDGHQTDLNAVHDAVKALFPARNSDEIPF